MWRRRGKGRGTRRWRLSLRCDVGLGSGEKSVFSVCDDGVVRKNLDTRGLRIIINYEPSPAQPA